ncbi:hypothetical protein EON83_10915 [bacterium]|nr:MAG: hypothetical protein EON83_10915 [bacterium]
MKQLLKYLLKHLSPELVWATGLAITLIGEIWGAFFDKRKGGTISEWFWTANRVIQSIIIFAMGGVFVHFIRWMRVLSDGSNVLDIDDKEGAPS